MTQLVVVLIAFLAISFSADLAQAQSPLDRVIAGNLQLIDQYSSYGYGYHGYGGYGYGYRRPNFGHRLGRIFEYGAVRAIDDYFDRRQPVIMMPGYEEPYYPSTRYPEAKVQSNSSNRVSRGIISFVRNVSGVSLYIYYWENGQRHLRSAIFP